MKTLLVTIALGASFVATAAAAQDQGGGRGLAARDQTRQEALQTADGMFQRIDLNHDGVVTRQEAEQAASQYGGGNRFERMIDRTFGSAPSLTLQQFEGQAMARFDRDDLNHDGVVTAAERQQARATLKAERAAQGEGPGAPMPPPGAMAPPPAAVPPPPPPSDQ
jgi:hypothetical protein